MKDRNNESLNELRNSQFLCNGLSKKVETFSSDIENKKTVIKEKKEIIKNLTNDKKKIDERNKEKFKALEEKRQWRSQEFTSG